MIDPFSRPALEGDREADACVIGGGMTGAATALELARRGARVILLEAGSVGAGASGRNLGHVATGLGCHYGVAVRDFGREGARAIWETHRENHARVRELLAEMGRDCAYVSRGGFVIAADREEAAELAESEDLLREDGFAGEFLDHYMLESRFAVSDLAGAYWAADDAEIDGLAFTRSLAAFAEARGAEILEATPVRALQITGGGVLVQGDRGRVRAGAVVVALNAFVSPLVPYLAERIRPLRAQCLSMDLDGHRGPRPSPAYWDRGRVYWRQSSDRLAIGGFDDLAFEEECTTALGTTPVVQDALERFARQHLGVPSPCVRDRWSGILGISLDGFPFIGRIPDTPLVAATGFTGLGYGYTMLAARWAAECALTGDDPAPARYRASRPFTPGPWPPWARP